jgi:8-oxo-dGTP diphosphatase
MTVEASGGDVPTAEPAAGDAAVTILVVRHADAGDRDAFDGPDHLRPLTGRGLAQARGLVDALDGFAVARALSSPYLRCIGTVEPLATAEGLAVESCDDLAEGAGPAAVDLVTRIAAGAEKPDRTGDVVLCTHGDVVLEVLGAVAGGGVTLPADLRLQKGSTWALAVRGGRVVGARYLEPPAPRS